MKGSRHFVAITLATFLVTCPAVIGSQQAGHKIVVSIAKEQVSIIAAKTLDYSPAYRTDQLKPHAYHLSVVDATGEILHSVEIHEPGLRFFDWEDDQGNITGTVEEVDAYTISLEIPPVPAGGSASIFDGRGEIIVSFDQSTITAATRRATDYPIFRLDTLQYSGDPQSRIDLVVMGDGYMLQDTTRYWDHVNDRMAYVSSIIPYAHYWERFNVYSITAISNYNGADHHDNNYYVDTYFDAGYWGRLIGADSDILHGCAAQHVPQYDEIILLVNDGTYGGSGAPGECISSAYHPLVLIHEFGHSFGLLWDEYTYGATCSVGEAPNCDDNQVNPKWQHWIDAGWPSISTFLGCSCNNAYRPTPGQCMMEVLLENYCIVCIEQIIRRVYEEAPNPIISSSPADYILTDQFVSQSFAFSYTDAATHPALISWSVDSTDYADSNGTSFSYTPAGYGTFTVSARIQDTTSLEIIVPDDWLVTTHSWTLEVVEYICGDADGSLSLSISDAVFIINYVFSGGAVPDPLESADSDCNGSVSIGDAVYLINYIFAAGPTPCGACP